MSAATTDVILNSALAAMDEKREAGMEVTIRDLLAPLGVRTNALGCALLSIPFIQPFSLGPITTAVSAVIFILALGLFQRRDSAPVPEKWLGYPVPTKVQSILGSTTRTVLRIKNRISRPRRIGIFGANSRRVAGAMILVGSVLLAVPIPLLPLTNTLPAIGIICSCLGWTEDDDVLKLIAIVFYILATLLFVALGLAVYFLGLEAVRGALPGFMGGAEAGS